MGTMRFARVAQQLALDVTGVEVVNELQAEGIRSIMIKGAAIVARLYGGRAERESGDIDLLVEPTSAPRAEAVLERLGFINELAGAREHERAVHATAWTRARPLPAEVDLHTSLFWCSEDPVSVWRELSADTGTLEIGGTSIEILGDHAQAFVIAAHALQHGSAQKPRRDLARALACYDRDTWVRAAALASRLNAQGPFAAGLRLDPDGQRLVDELGLTPSDNTLTRLLLAGTPPMSMGVLRLADETSTLQRLRLLLDELAPTPTFMREWLPFAGRGRAALALTYLYRPLWIAWHLPAAWRAWRAARG